MSSEHHQGSVAALKARTGHNYFLVPQINYMRNLSGCGVQTELHVLCTESLSRDWRDLLLQHGDANAQVAAAENTTELRVNARNTSLAQSPYAHVWRLSADERAYWNDCLFPWDKRLHTHLCSGKGDGVKSFLVPSAENC